MRLQIDQKQKEVKAHGTYGFPVLVSPERLSWFDTGEFPWHWHPEIELTLILEGEILYQVNDNSCLLKAGEGLFCNTNVLHAGRHGNSADCSYLSVTFHPRLLYGYNNSLMQNRYMEGRSSQDKTGIRSGSGVLWCIFRNIMRKRSRWKNWQNRFIYAAAKAAVCSSDI